MALELPAMVRITSAALHLPEDPELGTPQWETDATPFVVAVGDHLWDVWEEDDAVERFVATVRSEVAAADGQPWQPERWFVSGGSSPQVAAERGDAWSATPVFPHQLDRYPTIGTVRCFRDSATDSR